MNPQFFVEFSAIIVLVAVVNYWLLFPTLVMAIIFYFLRHVYTNTARSIKRVEASSMLRKNGLRFYNLSTEFMLHFPCCCCCTFQRGAPFSPMQMHLSKDSAPSVPLEWKKYWQMSLINIKT